MSSPLEINSIFHEYYQIQQLLQETNFERIYLATDLNNRENYQIKEYIARNPDAIPAAQNRFQAELNHLKNLQNPQIQALKDYLWQEDRLFLILPHIPGQTYQNYNHPPISEQAAIQLFNEILPIFTYIHSQNIAHGNISPNTILLKNFDNRPVLTNFGILQNLLTQLGIETPETPLINQIRNLQIPPPPPPPQGDISIENDLYSLAITIVTLLTGKPLQVLYQPQTQTWDWETWKLVSDQLTQVLNKMLSPNPWERYNSAEAVRQALNTTPTTIPPAPLPPPSPYLTPTVISPQLTTQPQKDKTPLIAFAIGTSLTLIGIVAIFATNKSPNNPTTINQIQTPSQTTSPTPNLTPLTQQQALNIINQYLQAKSQIFAPPYNRQLAATLVTGRAYQDILGPDGTIDWLQQRNAYYRYGRQNANPTGYFNATETTAEIEIIITEELTLYVNGNFDNSKQNSNVYRFSFFRENGTWKIANREVINQ